MRILFIFLVATLSLLSLVSADPGNSTMHSPPTALQVSQCKECALGAEFRTFMVLHNFIRSNLPVRCMKCQMAGILLRNYQDNMLAMYGATPTTDDQVKQHLTTYENECALETPECRFPGFGIQTQAVGTMTEQERLNPYTFIYDWLLHVTQNPSDGFP